MKIKVIDSMKQLYSYISWLNLQNYVVVELSSFTAKTGSVISWEKPEGRLLLKKEEDGRKTEYWLVKSDTVLIKHVQMKDGRKYDFKVRAIEQCASPQRLAQYSEKIVEELKKIVDEITK